ncbi:flagellar hook-length control protein FliK [Breoghania sp. L-A4]|uniref:flagellar hook-length control protein FliK n=1 Tax=Breoghania sp. L-A4 TaxID=2304600 RepID=UPI0020BDDE04|nr:flagellar hook-length control protein FliK [Breoghania sp. L-A4]
MPQTGAVDTLMTLRADSVAVTLWAESGETAARFRADVDALREAFGDVGLEATRIDIRRGRPSAEPQKAGYFVDWRT